MSRQVGIAALQAPERTRVYESDRPCGRKMMPQVVWDRDDLRRDLLAINELHDPDGGVVVVHAPPKGTGSLAFSILRALGKSVDVVRHRDPYNPDLALSWLRGEQVQELVIYSAHRLDDDLWKLIEFGPRVWLITPSREACERFRSEYATAFKSSARKAINALRKAAPVRNQPEAKSVGEVNAPDQFPPVAFNDFTTFLAACHDITKDPGDASLIQEAFMRGRNTVWSTSELLEGSLNSRALLTRLGEVLISTRSQREAICVFRGMQVGFFWTGHALIGDLRDLLAVITIDRKTTTDHHMRIAIRGQTAFLPASAAVLAHCTSLTDAEIASLPRKSLRRDCRAIDFEKVTWEIPPELRSPLRILTHSWTREEKRDNDLLYKHYRKLQQPIEIKRAIWRFEETTGVTVRAAKTEHSRTNKGGQRPLIHRHLKIEKLTSP